MVELLLLNYALVTDITILRRGKNKEEIESVTLFLQVLSCW